MPHRVRTPTKKKDAVTPPMKPDRIVIKRLFGQYNHDIALHQDSRVTVLIGINGTGKTTILRMIDEISRADYRRLYKEPFRTIGIGFGGAYYEFGKEKGSIRIRFRPTRSSNWDSYRVLLEGERSREIIQEELAELEERIHTLRMRRNELAHRREMAEIQQSLVRHEAELEYLMSEYDSLREQRRESLMEMRRAARHREREEAPIWLAEFYQRFHCHLISAERLYRLPYLTPIERSRKRGSEPEFQETILFYANQLSQEIMEAQLNHSEKSLELNQNFVNEAFGSVERHAEIKSWEEYKKELDEIEATEQLLVSTGFLRKTERPPLPDILKKRCEDPIVASVLATYIRSSKEMYSVFTELLEKTAIFTQLVNSHLTDKQIVIGAEEGYVVKLKDGSSLELTQLSSGEQHLIVLAYELIFEVKRGTFVLIDEPELSLHVAWQQDFNDDLRIIGNARDLVFLLATHSTAIVDREWDICYELERP